MSIADLVSHVESLARGASGGQAVEIAGAGDAASRIEQETARLAGREDAALFRSARDVIYLLQPRASEGLLEGLAEIVERNGAVGVRIRRWALPSDAETLRHRLRALAAAEATRRAEARERGPAREGVADGALERARDRLGEMRLSPYASGRSVRRRTAAGWADGFGLLSFDLSVLALELGLERLPDPDDPAGAAFLNDLERVWLGQALDAKPWRDRPLALPLRQRALESAAFVDFVDATSEQDRAALALAVDWSLIVRDVADGGHRAGFWRECGFETHVAGVRAPLLGLIDFGALDVTALHLHWTDDLADRLKEPKALRALRAFGSHRIVLRDCVSPVALRVAAELGVEHLEGEEVERRAYAPPERSTPAAPPPAVERPAPFDALEPA